MQPTSSAVSRMRKLGAVRLAWAVLLLACPERVITSAGGKADRRAIAVARVLGARHALQGLAETAAAPRWSGLGALVDALHALSGLTLAGLSRPWRRVALTDASMATTFAVAGLAA